MKALKVISIFLAAILSAIAVEFVTARCVTGTWNPAEWQNTAEIVQPKDGADGVDGKDGADGKDGQTPHIGENGNWFIGETDTGVKAAGQDGQPGTKLYRHSINAQYTGKVGNNVSFIIYSSDAEPYTATMLPKGEIVSGMSYYNSEVPLTVHILENGKAEITILDLSSDTPYLMHYTADTITDTVTEV